MSIVGIQSIASVVKMHMEAWTSNKHVNNQLDREKLVASQEAGDRMHVQVLRSLKSQLIIPESHLSHRSHFAVFAMRSEQIEQRNLQHDLSKLNAKLEAKLMEWYRCVCVALRVSHLRVMSACTGWYACMHNHVCKPQYRGLGTQGWSLVLFLTAS